MAVEADEMAARLRAEFPHALRSGQLVPYFQPEVELSSGRVVAAESLARWEHPEYGTLLPALFTPLAENLGLMGELTRLMLRQSLAQHRTWAAAGWVIPVSVNVGPDCVIDPAFPDVIAEFLRSEQVPGPMLALEVSEQTGTSAVSSSFFAQLAEFGVRVALDDFGTGFASLESLGGWPVDELKLDMSLVRPIASNSSFRTIVIVPGITSLRAIQIAARLTGPPARVTGRDGQPVIFSVSVGIAESRSSRDLPTLLARADLAMYEAKRAGGGCWRRFEDTEQTAADPVLPTV